MKKIRVMQTAAVLVFSMGLTSVAIGAQGVFSNQNEQEHKLVAGVSAAIHSEDIRILNLNSGVASVLTDFHAVSVEAGQQNVVAQGQVITDSTEAATEEETSICGYTNIGIANVEGNLNVRKEASASAEIVGKMTENAACEILGTEGEWTKITSGEVEGYVKSEYLLSGDEAVEVAKSQIIKVAKVNTNCLRVREEASTDADILSLVGTGEELTVVEALDGWLKVSVDNEEGYISADYAEVYETIKTAQTLKELRYGTGVSNVRVDLVSYALQFVGNPYVWGGTSLTNGADCSGFTLKIYQKYGIYLPHYSGSQPAYGTKISASEAQPGDLFFYGGSRINHVGIYIGNGKIVHASSPETGIMISNAFYRQPICVVSYLN